MKSRKMTAILLSVLLAFSCTVPSLAADEAGKPYSPVVHAVDNALGVLHDGIFFGLQNLLRKKDIPSFDAFQKAEHPLFYAGTDGVTRGNGWSAGYASESVIPAEWRCTPDGKADPEGYCIRSGKQTTGGYQNKAAKIYADQRLNLFILSNGADANGNGVPDLTIFISVDGVGITSGTAQNMRKGIEEALASAGVTHDDILACNVSATHCHNALDTQGMAVTKILMSLPRCLFKIPTRTLDPEMEATLVAKAGACAKSAFSSMDSGTLSFFETDSVIGSGDRLHGGVRLKDWFSCFLFESDSGEKTILANLAKHPTSYWKNYDALYTDFPYYMWLSMKDLGYNFLFTQSAQATIYGGSAPENSEWEADAQEWAKSHWLTYEDWVERYGKSYAKRNYDRGSDFGEQDLKNQMTDAYCMTRFVLDAADSAKAVSPTLRILNQQSLLKLDNGLMALGAITGLLGEDVVSADGAESGYGIVVETNYMEIGEDVAILTSPGEFSPALLLGSDPDPAAKDGEYSADTYWNGQSSWSGETWTYDTLENIVREATGDSDKTVLLYGITNDAIGYVYPDVCSTQSILGALFYRKTDSMTNNMMLTTGVSSGSQFMDNYISLLDEASR